MTLAFEIGITFILKSIFAKRDGERRERERKRERGERDRERERKRERGRDELHL